MMRFPLTLNSLFERAGKVFPDVEIVSQRPDDSTHRYTYKDWHKRAQSLASALQASGLKQGDRVATLMWNHYLHLEAYFAIPVVGGVLHTLNLRLHPDELTYIVNHAADRFLIVDDVLLPLFEMIKDRVNIERVFVNSYGGCAPVSGYQNYEQLLQSSPAAPSPVDLDEEDALGMCYTSGTTGKPKGVVYSHRSNYLHTVHQLQADACGLTSRDSVLVAVPMFHANGWGFPFAGPAAGARLVLPGRHQDGPSLARLINAESVTLGAGVATVWLGLVDHLDRTGAEVPTLERIMIGGASVPQALMDRLEQRLGVRVQTSWGMTELSPLGTATPPTASVRRASRAGRPAIGVDLLLTDADGVPLPDQRGHEGRLRVRGASVIARYFGEDEPAVDADGWLDTGDLAVIDGDGHVSITGRAKDLIKSGGEWINPGEIEAIVGALPEVALVAVIGRPHATWGERPVLIVELRAGAQITDDALLGALRSRVASWWLPDAIVRVAAMPLAATGKIDKKRLRADHGSSEDSRRCS
jgi:fatty-acyl-CoA synthase